MHSREKHLIVITSMKPLELAMLLETAVDLSKIGAEVKYLDLTGLSSKIAEFPIGEKLNSIIFKMKMTKIENKLNAIGIEKISLNYDQSKSHKDSRIQKLAEVAAKNEIISVKRESDPCLECYKKLNLDLIRTYTSLYLNLGTILKLYSFSNVYVYNGRFIIGNAVWSICHQHKTNVKFLEQANISFPDRYWLFEKPVHSPDYRAEIVNKFCRSNRSLYMRHFDKSSREWYSARTAGITQKFTSNQNKSFRNSSNKIKIASYFHSSEDELILSNLKDTSWGTQFQIINNLCKIMQSKSDFKLLIRIHPNLKNKSSKEIKIWYVYMNSLKQKYKNVEYLWFDSPINSYSLIERSQIIFTSGSTIGPESAFMGKSNVLCGNSLYSKMEISYKPKNPQELRKNFNFYLKHTRKARFIENAKRFGFFQMFGGSRYRHITVNSDMTRINYGGITLNYSKLYSVFIRIDKLYYIIYESKKRCGKC